MSAKQEAAVAVVLGAGPLGLAVAGILRRSDVAVRLWARRAEARAAAAAAVPGLTLCDSVAEAVCGARAISIVMLAVPAAGLLEVCAAYGPFAQPDHIVLHGVRGICAAPSNGTALQLADRVIRAHTCARKIGVMGGPLYAPDLADRKPLAALLASRFDEPFEAVAMLTAGGNMKIHQSYDIVGVQLAGAMSNVAAIAAGAADALGLGETAIGVLLTRGLSESAHFGRRLGADPRTFFGLAGVGDLIPRQVASTGRHRQLGELLAGGASLSQAAEQIGAAEPEDIEGVLTAREVIAYADRVRLPRTSLLLARAVRDICAGDTPAAERLVHVLDQHLPMGPGVGL